MKFLIVIFFSVFTFPSYSQLSVSSNETKLPKDRSNIIYFKNGKNENYRVSKKGRKKVDIVAVDNDLFKEVPKFRIEIKSGEDLLKVIPSKEKFYLFTISTKRKLLAYEVNYNGIILQRKVLEENIFPSLGFHDKNEFLTMTTDPQTVSLFERLKSGPSIIEGDGKVCFVTITKNKVNKGSELHIKSYGDDFNIINSSVESLYPNRIKFKGHSLKTVNGFTANSFTKGKNGWFLYSGIIYGQKVDTLYVGRFNSITGKSNIIKKGMVGIGMKSFKQEVDTNGTLYLSIAYDKAFKMVNNISFGKLSSEKFKTFGVLFAKVDTVFDDIKVKQVKFSEIKNLVKKSSFGKSNSSGVENLLPSDFFVTTSGVFLVMDQYLISSYKKETDIGRLNSLNSENGVGPGQATRVEVISNYRSGNIVILKVDLNLEKAKCKLIRRNHFLQNGDPETRLNAFSVISRVIGDDLVVFVNLSANDLIDRENGPKVTKTVKDLSGYSVKINLKTMEKKYKKITGINTNQIIAGKLSRLVNNTNSNAFIVYQYSFLRKNPSKVFVAKYN